MAIEGENTEIETQTDDGGGEPAADDGAQGAAPDGAEGGAAERKPSRRDRRASFATREEATEAKRIAQEEREARIRLEAQVQELRQHVVSSRERPAANPQSDYDARIKEARDRWEMHAAAANGAKSQAEARMHLDAVHKAQEDMEDIRDERRWEKRRGELAQSVPNPAVAQAIATVTAEHPWIATDPEARALADAKYNRLTSQGRPHGLATLREAATLTAKQLGLGGKGGAPTQQQRRAYDGTETRDGDSGGGGSPRGMTPEFVKNNDSYRKLALARFPELEPDQAIKKWIERVGSKLSAGNA